MFLGYRLFAVFQAEGELRCACSVTFIATRHFSAHNFSMSTARCMRIINDVYFTVDMYSLFGYVPEFFVICIYCISAGGSFTKSLMCARNSVEEMSPHSGTPWQSNSFFHCNPSILTLVLLLCKI